ncbi:CinA family protein [Okibacterium endophyticum]
MTAKPEGEDDIHSESLAASIAETIKGSHLRVAVAESLTSGLIATTLGAASGSSEWFLGGVVAYSAEVKHRVLGVSPGPVVSERAAGEMATGVAKLLGANVSLSVTGVGGPDELEGEPVGTVFIGCRSPHGEVHVAKRQLGGEPDEIIASTVVAALRLLESRVHALATEERHDSASK